MVELTLDITSRSGRTRATIQSLTAVMLRGTLERACLNARLYVDAGNRQSLRYVEQWPSLQELETQLHSPRFDMLLAVMETAAEPPELRINVVSEQRSLEYVSSVRLDSSNPG